MKGDRGEIDAGILREYKANVARAAHAYEMFENNRSFVEISSACGMKPAQVRDEIKRYYDRIKVSQRYPEKFTYAAMTINYFPLPTRAKNSLYAEGIYQIGDLAKVVAERGWKSLALLPNVGYLSMEQVRATLGGIVTKSLVEIGSVYLHANEA